MKKKAKRKPRFTPITGKTKPKTKRDLRNLHRNSASAEEAVSLEEKERKTEKEMNDDTQRPMAA
jgi:hypothetical protein